MKTRRYSVGSNFNLSRPSQLQRFKRAFTDRRSTPTASTASVTSATPTIVPAAPTTSKPTQTTSIKDKDKDKNKDKDKDKNKEEEQKINDLIKKAVSSESSRSSNNTVFKYLSLVFKPINIIKFNIFTTNFFKKTLSAITPDDNTKLTLWEKIKSFFLDKFYRRRINKFVHSITPEIIISLFNGKLEPHLKKNIIFGSEIPPEASEVTDISDKAKVMMLNTMLGKTLIAKAKKFITSLTPNQLILLSKGDVNLKQAFFKVLKQLKLPTKISYEEVKEVVDESLTKQS